MSPERHPCPDCNGPARLVQMTCSVDVYQCKCGMRFTITRNQPVVCSICQDTKKVGTGDPCPHCEDRELLNSITRY
jgi:hypothetical protein